MDDNPGVTYALQRGVCIDELHKKIALSIEKVMHSPGGCEPQNFSKGELQVLKACIEVACDF